MIVIPDELFILIFSQMPYSSLLQSTTVCRSWRLIILGNIFLCKQIFKIPTEAEETESCGLPSASHIQFHPAISRVTYCIGDTLDDVHLASYNASIRLVDLEVSNDFACIPSVTEIQGSISPTPHKRNSLPWTWSIAFTATNPDGVRVMDIFSSMVLASTKKYDMLSILSNGPLSQRLHLYQAPAVFTKAEILGKSKYFSGFSHATRKASFASVVVQTAISATSALALRETDTSL